MKRSQVLLGTAALVCSMVACDGLKEAFTAHVDQVARAQGQELSTDRIAKLIGNSSIPVRKDVISVVSDFWVSYQLLGYAGAHGDALGDSTTKNWWVTDKKLADEAMWASVLTARTQHFYDQVSKKFPGPDTTGLEQKYAQGQIMAAQHILILMPESGSGLSKEKQDSIRKKADDIRKKVTSANFDAMAKQYTEEPGGKDRAGKLGAFPPAPGNGSMVAEFEAGVKALKPGEVSPALVQTSFGFHIIRRNLLSEVRPEVIQKLTEMNVSKQQVDFIAKLRADWKVTVKPEALAKIREVAKSPELARADKTVLFTSRNGDFTAARLSQWIEVIPPNAQVRDRLASGPDSNAIGLVRSLVDQEILGAEAAKQGVGPDSAEVKQIHTYFTGMVQNAMTLLRVDPKSLGDSAKSTGEKEKLAASRVEDALDQLFATNGQSMVEIPPQLASVLRMKYSYRVNTAGVDRAVESATAVRASSDSARAKAMPTPAGLPPGAQAVPVPPGAPRPIPPPATKKGG